MHNNLIKLTIFIVSISFLISCSSKKNIIVNQETPIEFNKYVDDDNALYQIVQTFGTNENIIKREAQLTAMSLIVSRVETKIKSISEFRQTNSETNFVNITRLLSEFKVLNIELIDSKLIYNNNSNKYTFWGVYKVNSNDVQSLLNKNESLNLSFKDIIQ